MFNFFGRSCGCGQCGCRENLCRNRCNGCGLTPETVGCETGACCPVCPFPAVPDIAPYTVVFNGGNGNAAALTSADGAATDFAITGTGSTSVVYAPFSSAATLSPAEQASAFALPATGTLFYFNASFVMSAPPSATNAAIYAALMYAPKGSNVYSLVPGSTITLASGLTSSAPSGSVYTGAAKLCLPVADGRIAVACFVTDNVSAEITGYLSGTLSVK